jgi:hypothetical protein
MGSVAVGTTLSLRQLLFPSEAAGKQNVDNHLDVLVTLPAPVSREQVIAAVLGVLDIPLGDVIFRAWESFSEVRKAMAETRGHPESRQQVRVAGHTLTSTHHPTIECDLEGKKLFDLVLDLDLSLHFDGVVVTVGAGEIVAIGPGDAVGSASLKAKSIALVPDQEVRVTFPEPIVRRG